MTISPNLLTPFNLGPFVLRNRIVHAPLTRARATVDHIPTEMMATYYAQRADAGLLIAEATGITRQGLGWYRVPGIYNNKQIVEWVKIVDKVHKRNGIIALQLWHMGRQAHSDVTGQQNVSASPIPLKGMATTNKGIKKPYQIPKELNEMEINQIVQDFGNAAINAINAGFDAIEIHGANGYLVDTFLQSCSNKRTDKYGGSIDNRLLFMKQIVMDIINKGIDSYRIGIRLSPNTDYGETGSKDNVELFTKAIEWLTSQNIGYIHLEDGIGERGLLQYHKLAKPITLKMAKDIMNNINQRKDLNDVNTVNTALIGNNGYTKESAEQAISCGDGDLIAFGRDFMSNPDLVYRFENNIDLAPIAEYKHWYEWNGNEKGYIDWPMVKPKRSNLSKL